MTPFSSTRPICAVLLASAVLLSACDQPRVERVELHQAQAEPLASPDTEGATWSTTEDERGINFGLPGEKALLTLRCRAPEGELPILRLIRHAPAQPGKKALFPVIGNGMIARFKVDAVLTDNEWRWEGIYPADAPEWQVFSGPRDIEATLPGGGTLQIAGSTLPREFITWCRSLRAPELLPPEQ